MNTQTCTIDDLIEMTPPTARIMAQQETKRFVLVSMLMVGLSLLCVLAATHFNTVLTAKYALGVVAFLPQAF